MLVFHQKFGLLHALLDVLVIGTAKLQIDLLNHAYLLAFDVKSLVNFPERTASKIVPHIELVEAPISATQVIRIFRAEMSIYFTDRILSSSGVYPITLYAVVFLRGKWTGI